MFFCCGQVSSSSGEFWLILKRHTRGKEKRKSIADVRGTGRKESEKLKKNNMIVRETCTTQNADSSIIGELCQAVIA